MIVLGLPLPYKLAEGESCAFHIKGPLSRKYADFTIDIAFKVMEYHLQQYSMQSKEAYLVQQKQRNACIIVPFYEQ